MRMIDLLSERSRRGSSQTTLLVVLGSLGVLALLIAAIVFPAKRESDNVNRGSTGSSISLKAPLLLYCAASNKPVVSQVVADFTRETGIEIQVQYGPSQTLLSGIEVARTGDLYLPADDAYLQMASEKGLSREEFPLVTMQAVLVVAKGNPKQIQSFADLLKPEIRVSLANAEATAIGKLTKEVLEVQGQWQLLAERTQSFKTTVNDVANDVKIGAADVGIVWNAVAAQYPELESIPLLELKEVVGRVAITVLSTSDQPTAAISFGRYLSAEDKGLAVYTQMGYSAVAGDAWEIEPEVKLYAGSMLRPAVEKTIQNFERREGVQVTRVYNGCGILVGMMQTGELPDAYFACDQEFMNQVREQFPQSQTIAGNQLVILVLEGNPHGIKSLRDLTRPGLRVGIGHEKQCAMGWLTQKTLAAGGLKTEVMANVKVQTPTGDMLVNQLRAGSLDAAVAYLSNAAGAADFLDAVKIEGIACSVATQPFGVSIKSKQKQVMQRLLVALRSEESKQRFLLEGFEWEPKVKLPAE